MDLIIVGDKFNLHIMRQKKDGARPTTVSTLMQCPDKSHYNSPFSQRSMRIQKKAESGGDQSLMPDLC